MKINVVPQFEHRVYPKPTHVSDTDSKFQAILPGASSFGSCSCGALSIDLLSGSSESPGVLF